MVTGATSEQDATKHGRQAESAPSQRTRLSDGLSAKAFLEDLTRAFIAEYLAGTLKTSALVRKHAHPDFLMASQTAHDCLIPPLQGLDVLFDLVDGYPNATMRQTVEPQNITANVHRGTRTAEVFVTMLEKTVEEGRAIFRENNNVIYFERRVEDGVWMAYRHSSIRGGGGL